MKLINYLEKIDHHYNMKYDFLTQSKYTNKNIFNSVDELFVLLKSFDYINEVLKNNKIDDRIEIEHHNKNTEYHSLFNDFIEKKININQLKDKLVDYFCNNNDIKKGIKEIDDYKKSYDLQNIKDEKTNKKYEYNLDSLYDKSFRLLMPTKINLDIKFKNKTVLFSSGVTQLNFREFFVIYHDMLFHLLSDPNVIEKFDYQKEFGSFSNPYGYSPQEILKELFSLQTNAIAPNPSYSIKYGVQDKSYDLFKNLKESFENRKIPLTWEKFREVFKNYPKLLKIFPPKDYPDDHYFIKPNKKTNINVTPGSTDKIMKFHQISGSIFQGEDDLIKNFEGEIAFVLKRIGDLINKVKKNNNLKYIKKIFKDNRIIEMFEPDYHLK
jgi:hypothetical protein